MELFGFVTKYSTHTHIVFLPSDILTKKQEVTLLIITGKNKMLNLILIKQINNHIA